jgi:hypothetical protein
VNKDLAMEESASGRGAFGVGRSLVAMLLLALSLTWPAIINGAPILYPDSVGYYRSGEAAFQAIGGMLHQVASDPGSGAELAKVSVDTEGDGVSTQRSVYYGALVALLYSIGGTWLVIAVQAAVVATTVLIALRAFRALETDKLILVALALSLVSGVAVFTSAIMPDVFAGLMLLSMALLLACHDRLRPWERGWLFALTVASLLFHKSNLLVMAGTLVLASGLLYRLNRFRLRPVLILGLLVVLSGAAHGIVGLVVHRLTGETPTSPPFILARLIGDGTAVEYLRRHCPDHPRVTCEYLPRMPMTENNFLWSSDPATGIYGSVPLDIKNRIEAEERSIAIGTITEFPVQQLAASSRNVVGQFLTAGVSEFRITSGLEPEKQPGFADALERYKSTLIYRRAFPLPAISMLVLISYLGCLAIVVVLAIRWLSVHGPSAHAEPRIDGELSTAALVAVTGVIVNALICGVLSGVFDRYQGRLAWLMPLFAVLCFGLARQLNWGWRTQVAKG